MIDDCFVDDAIESKVESQDPSGRRRRPRYSGTHPKRFADKYKEHHLRQHPELAEHLRAKGKTPAGTHIPILVNDVIEALSPAPSQVVVDCTLGYGGHAAAFISRITPGGRLIGLDVDGRQLAQTRQRLGDQPVAMGFYHSNFAGLAKALQKENLAGCDILFADLGVSSMQIDNPDRGMSYKYDGPLDMRMDERLKRTGADVLNTLSEPELSEALRELADEDDYAQIAAAIVAHRRQSPMTRTRELVEIVFAAKGMEIKTFKRQQRQAAVPVPNPAAKTFQALRILVNDELGALAALLRTAPYCLNPGGRIGIISFHSGEDRRVKKAFKEGLNDGVYAVISDGAIRPSRAEIAANPRSASAKFRWAVKQ